jgi:DNA helicase-2/ATP-dependent DNA helicase PcrA
MKKLDFLAELNEAQQQAALYTEGPSLIIAGAGSGKTRVLTYRIAVLLNKGVPPQSILALTFTNKAAREMRERISQLVGPETASAIWMGTFHSKFANILRFEADKLGYPRNFSIYDTVDSKNLVKQVIKDMNLSDQVYKPGEVLSRISGAKNNLLLPDAYLADQSLIDRDRKAQRPETGVIYRNYCTRSFLAGAMDFDDLLLKTNVLLRDFPEVLQHYQKKFSYILVDEYQDTNFSQYLIVKKLSQVHQNVCVVGDDAQSIYAFRGAKIENILNFKIDYPDLKLFKLEQNYRSTQNIVNAANSIIKKNANQIRKTVFSENEIGQLIKVVRVNSDIEEGIVVSEAIKDAHLRDHCHFSDFAILYRTNAQSRIFEDNLRKLNVPYRIFGGMSFYQRKEIKDLLAYFRLIINNLDDVSFERIINYPRRGIGETTLEKMQELARQNEQSLWDIASSITHFPQTFDKGTILKVTGFMNQIQQFREYIDTLDAYDAAHKIATETGILKELHNDKSPEGVSRYENIEELLNGIREFSSLSPENELPTLEAYLQNVTLATDADLEDENKNKVSIMTIHAAKGLEFRHIHLVGVEEELFPSAMSVGNLNDLEEERRLFYVALTRAMDTLTISYSERRQRWGKYVQGVPSRFIKEIGQEFVEMPPEKNQDSFEFDFEIERMSWSKQREKSGSTSQPLFEKKANKPEFPVHAKLSKLANKAKPIDNEPNQIQSDPITGLSVGIEVRHERFGRGTILALEGTGNDVRATVKFAIGGEKKLLLKFARLEII